MSQFFSIHPENPQARLINQAVDIIQGGGVVAYPTDSAYALGCHLSDKRAMERIQRIRQLAPKHNFTIMCRDLADIAQYAKVDNVVYRTLKAHTPGPYTFVLAATREVPKRLMHPKKKTIGMRVPANPIALDLLAALGEPLMSVSLIMPNEEYPLTDPWDIRDTLEHQVDLVIDGGFCGMEVTSIVDLSEGLPQVLRAGKGDISDFE